MQKISTLYKGSGKGKNCVLVSITSGLSVSRNTIKTSSIIAYKDYLEDYLQYDHVYLLATTGKETKVDPIYGTKDNVIFDLYKENVLLDYSINDVFTVQHALIFFGGTMPNYYFGVCNRICEWYESNLYGHFYNIQDDPDWITINPTLYIDKRVNGCKLRNIAKPYHYEETIDSKKYIDYNKRDVLTNCFNDTVVAYCGTEYPIYYQLTDKYGFGTPNVKTEPKYWDNFFCHYWSGVNKYIESKLTDFPFNDKEYDSLYYGYIKHDGERIGITEKFYNALDNTTMLITGKKPFSMHFKNIANYPIFAYPELWNTCCSKAKTTLLLCNGSVYNCFIMQRYFDLMLGDIIPLFYLPMDTNKTYVIGDELKDFMYVSTPEEFRTKVNQLTANEEFYHHIKWLQRKSVYEMFNDFMTDNTKNRLKEKLNLN